MMKMYIFLFFSIFIVKLVMFPHGVNANEGKFSITQSSVDCEGVSVWQSGAYQITGICSGLVYPYHDQFTGYALWVQPDTGGTPVRVTGIDRGLISASTDHRFTGMLVTAESSPNPRNPSNHRIVSGNLTLFNFPLPYQNQTTSQAVAQTQTPKVSPVTPTPTPIVSTPSSSTFSFNPGSVVLLLLAGVIGIIVFGVMYFMKSRSTGA